MPAEIKVAPPGITISQGRIFMVTNQRGEIDPETDAGVYAIDTRFICAYHLYINRQPWVLVNSGQQAFYASRVYLTNPKLSAEDGDIEANTISLTIDRTVEEGIHEDFYIVNYAGKRLRLFFQMELLADFADIFEVKSKRIVERGRIRTRWDQHNYRLSTSYDHEDFHRAVIYSIPTPSVPIEYANGRIIFEIELEPNQEWHTCGDIILEHGQHVRTPAHAHRQHNAPLSVDNPEPATEMLSFLDQRQMHWLTTSPGLETPNDHVYRMYRQAVEDMGALRIYDLDVSQEEWVPAAGVPWFVTLFGRDSLIVSLQAMCVSTGFARGALKRLSEYQASDRDDYHDAQPGKILHEIRFGELAHFHRIPHTPYYGTADATILYLIALSETYRWTGDVNLLKHFRKVAEGCLDWIDHYGDLDGDGFQEYKTYSTLGYENVGWKDAWDSVVYADGTQVKQPKGLCELQGYVYDAKARMAEIFDVLGDHARAQALRTQAATLKQKFNEVFWMEDQGCYAYGLDPEKKLITSIASNVGHCLWSGIADQDKAERTAKRLLQEDMWSGWGIRTISSRNPAYNPFSYHLGSVWPHDNSIIAAGFKRYGLADEANFVIRGIFDAARRFESYRLPEIFAGIRRKGSEDFPALYPPGANIPQAWASGSIFEMLRTILGLRADAPHKRLYVKPTLPPWLSELQLQRLVVGPCAFTLHFWREGDRSRWEVVNMTLNPGVPQEEAIEVVDEI
ncbi:MAG TPA: glycogen debranching N-terminal domain-containing protein [Ktedonobacteraceae bacterium]|jgi:glycogen debranching enzyme|nr:glycogen debranching N-terminal domain-containing protein [Ktedonobacteraceae bacterium]